MDGGSRVGCRLSRVSGIDAGLKQSHDYPMADQYRWSRCAGIGSFGTRMSGRTAVVPQAGTADG